MPPKKNTCTQRLILYDMCVIRTFLPHRYVAYDDFPPRTGKIIAKWEKSTKKHLTWSSKERNAWDQLIDWPSSLYRYILPWETYQLVLKQASWVGSIRTSNDDGNIIAESVRKHTIVNDKTAFIQNLYQ